MSDDFSRRPVSFVFTNYFFYRNYKSSFLNRVGNLGVEARGNDIGRVARAHSPALTHTRALALISDKCIRL